MPQIGKTSQVTCPRFDETGHFSRSRRRWRHRPGERGSRLRCSRRYGSGLGLWGGLTGDDVLDDADRAGGGGMGLVSSCGRELGVDRGKRTPARGCRSSVARIGPVS